MSKTMRAARYHGPTGQVELERLPVPEPGVGQVRVKIQSAGVCHTELHFLHGLLDFGVRPLTLGHEIAGEVEAVGPGVEEYSPGDRVLVYYYATCGKCVWCRTNRENLCPNVKAQFGFTADGGFAEYTVVPEANLVRVPETLTLDEAASLGCSAATAMHAGKTIANVGLGDTVVVYGAGAVGFSLVQLGKLAGARVIAVGRSERKLQVARETGADVLVHAGEEDVKEAILRATDREGADVVFDMVGTRESMENGVPALRRRGRYVFIGYSEDTLQVHPLDLVIGEKIITASVGNTYQELVDVVNLATQGKLRTVLDRTAPLESVNDVLGALERGEIVGRAILHPHRA